MWGEILILEPKPWAAKCEAHFTPNLFKTIQKKAAQAFLLSSLSIYNQILINNPGFVAGSG